MIEGAGGDFSANQLGKWKMVLQCGAVISILVSMIRPEIAIYETTSLGFLWGAIGLTVYSGIEYSRAAARIMSSPSSDSDSEQE